VKLSKEEVKLISRRILERLIAENVIELTVKKEELLNKINEFFIEELMVEDRLNEEVKKIMEKYRNDIEKGKVDYQKMFELIKKQLVRDRGLIL